MKNDVLNVLTFVVSSRQFNQNIKRISNTKRDDTKKIILYSNWKSFVVCTPLFTDFRSFLSKENSPVRKLDFLKFTVSDVTNLNFQGYPCDISHRHFYRFGGFFFQVGRENCKWRKENCDESDTKPVLFLVFLSFRIIFGASIRSVQMNIGKNPIWLNILKNLAES